MSTDEGQDIPNLDPSAYIWCRWGEEAIEQNEPSGQVSSIKSQQPIDDGTTIYCVPPDCAEQDNAPLPPPDVPNPACELFKLVEQALMDLYAAHAIWLNYVQSYNQRYSVGMFSKGFWNSQRVFETEDILIPMEMRLMERGRGLRKAVRELGKCKGGFKGIRLWILKMKFQGWINETGSKDTIKWCQAKIRRFRELEAKMERCSLCGWRTCELRL